MSDGARRTAARSGATAVGSAVWITSGACRASSARTSPRACSPRPEDWRPMIDAFTATLGAPTTSRLYVTASTHGIVDFGIDGAQARGHGVDALGLGMGEPALGERADEVA